MSGANTFEGLPTSLEREVEEIIRKCPESEKVFASLITHFKESQNESNVKRKKTAVSVTEKESASGGEGHVAVRSLEGTNIMLQLPELSVQSPFRKRLNLVFGAFKGEKKAYLALSKSLEVAPEIIIKTLTEDNIRFAAILNVPDKKQLRYLLVEYNENDGNVYKNEPLLIQFNNDQLQEQFGSILGGKTFVQYLTTQLSLVNFSISDCTSQEETFFVQAYKGNKEGYLYFLQNHVIFGFKKPILVFKSADIESITYNSITRLTFNVLFGVRVNGGIENYEFGMIDQKEFEHIDKFVRAKDVRDNSMADEHKAQKQLKNNTENPSDLAEAAKLIPGGEQLISTTNGNDDDDDEDDDNYEIGDSGDDHSDTSDYEDNNKDVSHDQGDASEESGDESDDEQELDDHGSDGVASLTPGTLASIDNLQVFEDNLQQELSDLQNDLDIDINELQKAGYIEM